MYLTLSVRGGHDDDMSTDRRDVMPGRMGGEENKSRQEGRMGEQNTRLLQQSNREEGRVEYETAPTLRDN